MTTTQTMDKLLQDVEKHQTTLKYRDLKEGLKHGAEKIKQSIPHHFSVADQYIDSAIEKPDKTKEHYWTGFFAGMAKGLLDQERHQYASLVKSIKLLGETGLIHSKSMTQYLRKGLERGVKRRLLTSEQMHTIEDKISQYTRT